MKSLLRHPIAQALLARFLGWYLALALRTTRWTLVGAEHLAPLAAGSSGVVAFWHEFLPLIPALTIVAARLPGYRPTPLHALVSQHRDGRFIGHIVGRFGITPVFGSSTRGGANGLRALLKLLAAGAIIGITPDGPRGPRRDADAGVAQLAALAGVSVIPCAARTTHRIKLATWDRMEIPLPFGRGVLVCGPAQAVARDDWRGTLPRITAGLNAVAERADQL